MDKNKHLFFMRKLLQEFYRDPLLASELKFKGGTAAMFFHGLPRFSTDLDFNLTDKKNQKAVFERIRQIVSKNGKILDCANKLFGPLVVLDYGSGERNLKIEVSNRVFDNHYTLHGLGSLVVPVLETQDMLTHKLCAMLERNAPRDVFDVWFFLSKGWALNENIIRERTGIDTGKFLSQCLKCLDKANPADMMMEIGELLDDSMKPFVRKDLIAEAKELLHVYIEYPIIADVVVKSHTALLFSDEKLLPAFLKSRIDPSTVSEKKLEGILSGIPTLVRNRKGDNVNVHRVGGRIKISGGLSLE